VFPIGYGYYWRAAPSLVYRRAFLSSFSGTLSGGAIAWFGMPVATLALSGSPIGSDGAALIWSGKLEMNSTRRQYRNIPAVKEFLAAVDRLPKGESLGAVSLLMVIKDWEDQRAKEAALRAKTGLTARSIEILRRLNVKDEDMIRYARMDLESNPPAANVQYANKLRRGGKVLGVIAILAVVAAALLFPFQASTAAEIGIIVGAAVIVCGALFWRTYLRNEADVYLEPFDLRLLKHKVRTASLTIELPEKFSVPPESDRIIVRFDHLVNFAFDYFARAFKRSPDAQEIRELIPSYTYSLARERGIGVFSVMVYTPSSVAATVAGNVLTIGKRTVIYETINAEVSIENTNEKIRQILVTNENADLLKFESILHIRIVHTEHLNEKRDDREHPIYKIEI
jgi:hypothetical protein